MTTATLGTVSLDGGAPRAMLEKICDADISPDGKQFAVVRCAGSDETLEYPLGQVLYRTNGYISHLRVSPSGDSVAFIDHPVLGDDRGTVTRIDSSGKLTRLTEEWSSIRGLAWQPSGREVWYTASQNEEAQSLMAVSMSGRVRTVLTSPGYLWLQDISAEGKVLLGSSQEGGTVGVHRLGGTRDTLLDLASESTTVSGVSDDGSIIGVDYSGAGSGPDYAVYLAKSDGSPLVRLGDGGAMGATPDGKWIIALLPTSPTHLRLLPTGAGEVRNFDISPVRALDFYGSCVHDSSGVAFTGSEPGKAPRIYLMNLNTGKTTAITPEGTTSPVISPDGKFVAARDQQQQFHIYRTGGGDVQPIRGLSDNEFPVQWDSTGTKMYVWDRTFPARIVLIDMKTGARQPWTTIMPSDSAGVLYGNMVMTPDGKTVVYRYRRAVTTLFLAEGLH